MPYTVLGVILKHEEFMHRVKGVCI